MDSYGFMWLWTIPTANVFRIFQVEVRIVQNALIKFWIILSASRLCRYSTTWVRVPKWNPWGALRPSFWWVTICLYHPISIPTNHTSGAGAPDSWWAEPGLRKKTMYCGWKKISSNHGVNDEILYMLHVRGQTIHQVYQLVQAFATIHSIQASFFLLDLAELQYECQGEEWCLYLMMCSNCH